MVLSHRSPGRFTVALLTLLWFAAIGLGFGMLWDYASAPGPCGEPPSQWPDDSQIARPNQRPKLLMFAHPKCPCTRASIDELARIVAQCGERLSVHVLFDKPPETGIDWQQTDLCSAAQSIPGVQVATDFDHREAARFAAQTSGFVLLYDANGRLLFHGGITSSRGHSGDNLGRDSIVELVTTGTSAVDNTSVFGCLLCTKCEGFKDD